VKLPLGFKRLKESSELVRGGGMILFYSNNFIIVVATESVTRGNAINILTEAAEKLLAFKQAIGAMKGICYIITKYYEE
jgi:hypothetical protein